MFRAMRRSKQQMSEEAANVILKNAEKVSNLIANENREEAHEVFKSSIVLLSVIGVAACLILIVFSKLISSLQGVENAFVCYVIISPSILSVSIGSAFKGYFQGLQNMIPTAVVQVITQIVKLSIGFVLASFLIKRGVVYENQIDDQ